MYFSEINEAFRISMDALRGNKLRALLASLGVVIGISFVILMGWVLSGLDKAVADTFKSLGTDMLYVDKWDWAGGKNWRDIEARKDITYAQALDLISRLEGSALAMPTIRTFGTTIKYGSDSYSAIQVQGTTSEFSQTNSGSVDLGRFFTSFESNSATNVVVLGFKAFETIFPDGKGLGKTIKIQGKNFTVIGKSTKQGNMLMDFMDNVAYIPINSFFSLFGKSGQTISIAVKAPSVEELDNLREETIGMMRIVRNIQPGKDNDFSINETKAFEQTLATLRMSVWGVGIGMTVLSFIVGIIGIMNIMFVSVTERTKEIGIRKAIGAKKRAIMYQFIIESSILCFFGALISFVLTSIFVYAVATILPKFVESLSFLSPYIPYDLLIIASVVSIVVGLLAGLIPAYKAANLDPIDALRYE